jgi:type II secretory pathway pseudopilin PulG
MLIAVAIIAILAAIAVPNLLTAINRSKQKRTMADMRNISTAWEARATDTARYNAAGIVGISNPVTISDLSLLIAPTYIKEVPARDGWSRPFQCFLDAPMTGGPQATQYAIVSAGRDGSFSTTTYTGPFASFDCDIIFANGAFLSYPEGVQSGTGGGS